MNILTTTDNAQGQLDAGITASDLAITLGAGEGDLFPATKNGAATSLGDKNTLNSTGILAKGVLVGDIIENVNDNSIAYVVSVSTDSVTTTDLRGGADNLWENSDVWAINRFVITIEKRTTSPEGVVTVTAFEKVLIKQRPAANDVLTVATGGRGFDGSSAQAFSATDFVVLHAIHLHHEYLKQLISDLGQVVKTVQDNKADLTTVQTLLQARSFKNAVRVTTTVNLNLATQVANGDTVNGVTLVTGDRILIKNQTLLKDNGIYDVQASGAPVRSSDFDAPSEVTASAVAVSEGTVSADTVWECTSDDPVIGTDPIEFIKISADPSLSAKFGGNGSDGSFSASSGTNTITTPVSQYSSFTLNGTALLDFAASLKNQTVVIKVAGDLTIGGNAIIDRSGDGGDGGNRGDPGYGNAAYGVMGYPGEAGDLVTNGNVRTQHLISETNARQNIGGGGGKVPKGDSAQYRRVYLLSGSGGQGGKGSNGYSTGTAQTGAFGGAGGNGAGSVVFEVAGDIIISGTPTYTADGVVGEAGQNAPSAGTNGGGGGGGGAAGTFLMLHNGVVNDTSTPVESFDGGVGGAGGLGSGASAAGQQGQTGENGALIIQENITFL